MKRIEQQTFINTKDFSNKPLLIQKTYKQQAFMDTKDLSKNLY